MACQNTKFEVCIVGAGGNGLCAAHHLHELNFENITIFEKTSRIGGIWHYESDPNFPNPLYYSLTTNLPHRLMQFPDYDFPNHQSIETYPHHTVVLQYIESYANHFNLNKFIKFNHEIIKIIPLSATADTKWKVSYLNHKSRAMETKLFDAVLICNGHYEKPYIPSICGLQTSKIKWMHSLYYRYPDKHQFDNRTIVIVGNAASGKDIGYEIFVNCENCKVYHITHTTKKLSKTVIHKRYIYKLNIKQFISEHFVCFDDDEIIKPDLVIFCTGYKFYFPFLDNTEFNQHAIIKNSEFGCNGYCVDGLFEQLFVPNLPTLFFVGLLYVVVPFLVSYFQSKWIAKILYDVEYVKNAKYGEWRSQFMPSTEKMNEWIIKNKQNSGARSQHVFHVAQFDYMLRLSVLMKQEILPDAKIKKLKNSYVQKPIKPEYIQSKL